MNARTFKNKPKTPVPVSVDRPCAWTLLTLSQTENSVSAFSSCLHHAGRSASGESLGSSQIFSGISCAGHACCFLHAFEWPNISKKCSPWLFLLGFKQAIICLNCNLLPQVVSLFKNCFLHMFPSSACCFSALSYNIGKPEMSALC